MHTKVFEDTNVHTSWRVNIVHCTFLKGVIVDTARLLLALHPPLDSHKVKIIRLSFLDVNSSVGPAALAQFTCFMSAEQAAEPSVKNCSRTAVNSWSFCQGNCVVVFVLAYLLTFVIYQEVIILTPLLLILSICRRMNTQYSC